MIGMNESHSASSNRKRSTDGNELLNIWQTTWSDHLVNLREFVLSWATASGARVLNDTGAAALGGIDSDSEITAELKRFLDTVRIYAIDEGGRFVDYHTLKTSRLYLEYRQYCSPRLIQFDPGNLTSYEKKMSFWINLYNALILDGVIASKITQGIGPNPLKLLAFFRRTAYNVGGYRMNADDIEHGILRCNRGHPMSPGPQFSSADPRLAWAIDPVDVRIHFALNCAGRSCPPIQVYSPQNLDSQLDLAARNFINQDISFDQGTHKVQLSTIFKWFAKDFGGRQGILDFLIEHLQDGDRKSWLRDNEEKIKFQYKAYDWRLNAFEMGPTFEKN